MRRYNEEAMTDPESISLMLSKEVGVLSKKKKGLKQQMGEKVLNGRWGWGCKCGVNKYYLRTTRKQSSGEQSGRAKK